MSDSDSDSSYLASDDDEAGRPLAWYFHHFAADREWPRREVRNIPLADLTPTLARYVIAAGRRPNEWDDNRHGAGHYLPWGDFALPWVREFLAAGGDVGDSFAELDPRVRADFGVALAAVSRNAADLRAVLADAPVESLEARGHSGAALFLRAALARPCPRTDDLIALTPARFRTGEFFLAAVMGSGRRLADVPPGVATAAHFLAAVECPLDPAPETLGLVPKQCRSRALCRAAVALCGKRVGDVPGRFRDEAMYRLAAENGADRYRDIPFRFQSTDWWREINERETMATARFWNFMRTVDGAGMQRASPRELDPTGWLYFEFSADVLGNSSGPGRGAPSRAVPQPHRAGRLR